MSIEWFLFIAIAISAAIAAVDKFWWAARRPAGRKQPTVVEYARSFLPILIIVFLLRSFLYEPFRIPSGSLKPSLLVGDLILVNKFDYGVRLPLLHNKVVKRDEPKVGDVVVFRWPVDTSIDYIKRVVGEPGDRVQYKNKVLYVNGERAKQEFIEYTTDQEGNYAWPVKRIRETINGVSHDIFVRPDVPAQNFDVTVPKNSYFMMGDNRDNSGDSRVWGAVNDDKLIGKAVALWMSWDGDQNRVRWARIGKRIK